jgi:hypothetical protein
MSTYPVHYHVVPPAGFSRLQLLVRFVAFIALGMLGLSFGAFFCFFYLALPAYAASRLIAHGAEPRKYLTEDGPRLIGVLRWFAALGAWTGLVAEQLPSRSPDETIRIEVEPAASVPTPGSVLVRVITSIPSAFVLGILCSIGVFVWTWAALSILFAERIGPGAFAYLTGLQRWSVRLLAYQAGLVDVYPPFSFSDLPPAALPVARAVS